MGYVRFRSTVVPPHRRLLPLHPRGGSFGAVLPKTGFSPGQISVDEAVARWQPQEPMYCLRPAVLSGTAGRFITTFADAWQGVVAGGDVLYAVKCNPDPAVLRALWAGGVRHFDVASPGEIRLMRDLLPQAHLHYMHPVKGEQAIAEAWHRHGLQDFALDDRAELARIIDVTGGERGADLGLIVRLAMPKGDAVHDLSGKFGATEDEAVDLLQAARPYAARLGLCFHVGSQMLDPVAWERALEMVGRVLARAAVEIDVLDVGGGFPVAYPDVTPPPLADFMVAIRRGVAALSLPAHCRLWCEPGRALVAAGGSLVLRVLKRRGNELFVTDGVYGALSDAGVPGLRFPVRRIAGGQVDSGSANSPQGSDSAMAFTLWGPTCDSADRMAGPFMLPADIAVGDWIELGQLGAYSTCLGTRFNGFDQSRTVEVRDAPLI